MYAKQQTNKLTQNSCTFIRRHSRSSGQLGNDTKTHPPPPPHHFPPVILADSTVVAFILLSNSLFNFHCYTKRKPVPTQKSARKCELRPFVTKDYIGHSLVQTSFDELPDRPSLSAVCILWKGYFLVVCCCCLHSLCEKSLPGFSAIGKQFSFLKENVLIFT